MSEETTTQRSGCWAKEREKKKEEGNIILNIYRLENENNEIKVKNCRRHPSSKRHQQRQKGI